MPSPIYHYTTEDRFLRIIAERAILPATAHVDLPEIPTVWLSCDPVWVASVPKGIVKSGNRHQANLAELIGLCGCLIRIEVDPSSVAWLGPSAFRETLRIPEDVHDRLIAACLEMGANLANCRADDLDPEDHFAEVIKRLPPDTTPKQAAALTPARVAAQQVA